MEEKDEYDKVIISKRKIKMDTELYLKERFQILK